MADAPPRIDDTPIAVIDDEGKSEASLETGIALDSKQRQIAEQSPADMDVDEELLSLIADDLPSRSSRTMLRKHELSSSEDKRPPSYLAPFKQESAMGTPTPSQPSPAPSSIAFNLETVSTHSPDPPVSARESEMSTMKLEERPTQKKKVIQSFFACVRSPDLHKTKQHAQPKSRPKQSGSAKTKLKISSDGPSTAPLKSKKPSNTVTKRSIISARSRSTSVMPVTITPAPGAENRAPGETELEDIEDGMEDKLYCICETKYDDEKIMIACDRCAPANSSNCDLLLYYVLHSCDEWYHTSCVNMPDQEVDLVDQFICPLCVESACARLLFYSCINMMFREPSPRSAYDLETSLPERAQAAQPKLF
jgi:COMPASS component SPP1